MFHFPYIVQMTALCAYPVPSARTTQWVLSRIRDPLKLSWFSLLNNHILLKLPLCPFDGKKKKNQRKKEKQRDGGKHGPQARLVQLPALWRKQQKAAKAEQCHIIFVVCSAFQSALTVWSLGHRCCGHFSARGLSLYATSRTTFHS